MVNRKVKGEINSNVTLSQSRLALHFVPNDEFLPNTAVETSLRLSNKYNLKTQIVRSLLETNIIPHAKLEFKVSPEFYKCYTSADVNFIVLLKTIEEDKVLL